MNSTFSFGRASSSAGAAGRDGEKQRYGGGKERHHVQGKPAARHREGLLRISGAQATAVVRSAPFIVVARVRCQWPAPLRCPPATAAGG